MNKKVGLLMGSKNDFETLKPCIKTLKKFGVEVEVHVLSAHRTPHQAAEFAQKAIENNFGVIICAAGKAAHLGGVIAAHTTLPVIGIPIKSSTLDGLDALLSFVQMPAGIPVATVAIDGAENAALLAIQMLAIGNPDLTGKLKDFKSEMVDKILFSDSELQEEINKL